MDLDSEKMIQSLAYRGRMSVGGLRENGVSSKHPLQKVQQIVRGMGQLCRQMRCEYIFLGDYFKIEERAFGNIFCAMQK